MFKLFKRKSVIASSTPQSSSSAHFSQGFWNATWDETEYDFYGIPLSNSITDGESWEVALLTLLVILLLFKNNYPKKAFWLMILSGAYLIKEMIYIPILTNIIYTQHSYPYLIVMSHCIVAAASYRKQGPQNFFSSFVGGFICYGFGGSIVSDLLMGLPVTALGHPRIVPCYIVAWCLVWYSPMDIIYQEFNNQKSAFHIWLVAWESVDAITTPLGRIGRASRELANRSTAPIVAGVLAGTGGAMIRYRVLHTPEQPSIQALEKLTMRTLGYSIMWWYLVVYRCDHDNTFRNLEYNHCSLYNGSDWLRVLVVMFHIVWTLCCDFNLATGHPFIYISFLFRTKVIPTLSRILYLGEAANNFSTKIEEKQD